MIEPWLLGLIGIGMEIVGAGIGFFFAFGTWRKWRALPAMTRYPMDKVLEGPKEEFVSQFPGHALAFLMLSLGLILQFMAGVLERTAPARCDTHAAAQRDVGESV